MTRASIFEQIMAKQSYLCVGLDTDLDRIPKHLLSEEDPIFAFNKAIIDATLQELPSSANNHTLQKL